MLRDYGKGGLNPARLAWPVSRGKTGAGAGFEDKRWAAVVAGICCSGAWAGASAADGGRALPMTRGKGPRAMTKDIVMLHGANAGGWCFDKFKAVFEARASPAMRPI